MKIKCLPTFCVISILVSICPKALAQGGCVGCSGKYTPVVLTTALGTVPYGSPVTLSVSTTAGATGSVSFYSDGSTYLGQVSLSNPTGVATFQTSILPVGTHTLSASYSGDANYTGNNSSGILETINRALPTITWPPLGPVMAGATIISGELNASASVPGAFTYSPSVGTVLSSGITSITATFIPTNTTDYVTTTYTNSIIVQPPSQPSGSAMTLSANSGINAHDTYAIMSVSTQTVGSVNPIGPIGVAQGAPTPLSTLVKDVPRTFTMEVGYDANGSPVVNILPPINQNGLNSNIDTISGIRYAGGQLTVFGANGIPISIVPPSSTFNSNWPLNPQALTSGVSILQQLVVCNIQVLGSEPGTTLTVSGGEAQLVRSTGGSAKMAALYSEQSSGCWMLQALSFSSTDQSGAFSRQIQFANTTYYDNAQNDAARSKAGHISARTTGASTIPIPAQSTAPNSPCGSSCAGTYTLNNFGGTQNVLFQHGFKSSGATWSRMTGWLNQDFIFGNEVVTSLAATASLSSQGQNLESLIQAAGGNQYILIGHSQGGLISRYAAQQFQTSNGGSPSPLVQGVITVDTPHLGAALTQTGPQEIGYAITGLAESLFGVTGCLTPNDNGGCYFAALVDYGATTLAQDLVSSVAALQDLTPGSPFLTTLNHGSETFQRASIAGQTDQRWLVARVADSITGVNPDAALGEDNIVDIPEFFYDAVTVDLIISSIDEIEWIDYCIFGDGADNGDPYCDQDFSAEIAQDTSILAIMDKIDSLYDSLIAPSPGDGSDGFVQNSSQVYPSSSAVHYVIGHADSHQAATRSPYDHTALDSLLSSIYKIATPAACSFSSAGPLISVPQAGGSFSASFSTTAGCQWSATSSSSWITISPASVSGTGAGSVALIIAALAGTIPRSGTIQIGNGTANVVITIDQAPATGCTYIIGVTSGATETCNVAFIGTGGGTVTVGVTTQTGCSWSAETNQSWLTTQNGNGVGSGSFTVNVAPTSVKQSGIINVMGSIITLNEENPPYPKISCSPPGNPHS